MTPLLCKSKIANYLQQDDILYISSSRFMKICQTELEFSLGSITKPGSALRLDHDQYQVLPVNVLTGSPNNFSDEISFSNLEQCYVLGKLLRQVGKHIWPSIFDKSINIHVSTRKINLLQTWGEHGDSGKVFSWSLTLLILTLKYSVGSCLKLEIGH